MGFCWKTLGKTAAYGILTALLILAVLVLSVPRKSPKNAIKLTPQNLYEFVRSLPNDRDAKDDVASPLFVIPAQAGIQSIPPLKKTGKRNGLDSRFRGNDSPAGSPLQQSKGEKKRGEPG